MNNRFPNRSLIPAGRLVSTARLYLALLLLAATAQAQIAIQDGSPLTITHATGTTINKSFTVTAGAKAMVIILEEKGARLSEPATLSWTGQLLNRTVQTAYNNGVQRSLAIYYLFNPTPGTANITGTMAGAATDTWLTAYTLAGVDTIIAPIAGDVNTGTDGTGVFSLTINLTGVASNAWAVVAAQYANFPDSVTVTGTGGTGTVITDTNYNVTGVTAGYVTNLSAGAVSLTTTWVRAEGPQKANFAALVFAPSNGVAPISPVKTFGIKFLGNTTNAVTTKAGAFPISFWSNIANASYTAGTIYSSDGSINATLTLSGSGADNAFKSGVYPDDGNFSLLYGYQDAGQNAPATNVISGLTGAAYDVYLYTAGDNARPSSATDWLPNYTVNGTTYYTATRDGRSALWNIVQGIPVSQNDNTYPTTLVAGHYIKISNVVPVGGKITISANSDNLTFRSPLNGIEIMLRTDAPQIVTQPLAHRLYTGGTAQFKVEAQGVNPLAYQWRQNGTNLIEGGRIIGSQTDSLTITNLVVTDTGDYDVVITNSSGSVTSSVAHLDAVVMTQADAAFEAWIAAYKRVDERGATFITESLEDRYWAWAWQQAFMHWTVTDAYTRTQSPDLKRVIYDLQNTFLKQEGNTLTWQDWNDDIEWEVIALIKGYQITGNRVALNTSIYAWEAVFTRAWDDTFGGGIWEKMPKDNSKCALSNYPQIIGGIELYYVTGDTNYITQCEMIYAWSRENLFICTPAQATNGLEIGQVIEGIAFLDDATLTGQKQLISKNVYNSGLLVQAACALYEVTGNPLYLDDATLGANYMVNRNPIMSANNINNGYFGAEQLVRGVARLASLNQNKLWPTYWPWMKAQCTAAWAMRRTDLNLTKNKWTEPTGTNDLKALETQSAFLVQQLTPASIPGFVACTNKFSGAVIGTSGSFNNGGNTIAKAFDSNLTTFFDAPVTSGAWVGLDLGTSKVIGQINYWPRGGWAGRMLGGIFQGDNTANFSNPVTLYTIAVVPPDNGTVTAIPITNPTAFRYVRYVGPANGSCNVAELQVFSPNPPPPPIYLTNSWNGSQMTLSWPSGQLLEATNLTGPWTTNASATSPFVITPDAPQKFYRVIAP